MALNNISLPNAATDVVAVFDADLNQVFEGARAMKIMVNEASQVMEHPVETGVTITDHIIILPTVIELSTILQGPEGRNVYQQIKQLKRDGILLTVQSKVDSYPNMIITDMPHDEDPEMFNATAVAIKLKEVLFVTARFGTLPASKVRDKTNASTVNKGEVQTTESTDPNTSALYDIFATGRPEGAR